MLLLLGRAEVRRRPDVRVLVQRLDSERRPDLELAAVVRLVLARLAFQGVPSGNEETGRTKCHYIFFSEYLLCFWTLIDVEIPEGNADQAQKLVDSQKVSV